MHCKNEAVSNLGLKYATSFDEKLLGTGCDVEVVIEIESGEVSAVIAMRQFLRSSPVFRISDVDLAAMSDAIKSAKRSAKLLENMVDGATDHHLNYAARGASLTIVHPKEKKARFVLSIGAFTQEGDLEKLSDVEIVEALKRIEELKSKVTKKIGSAKK